MKYILALITLVAVLSPLFGLQTANSLPVAGSYLLRAHGTEALYWNPAAISNDYQDIIIPGFNLAFDVSNNAFDIDTYNYISGRFLTPDDKEMLLDKIDQSLQLRTDMHLLLLGMTFGNVALSTSTNVHGNFKLSEQYLRIVLYGNEETDYVFGKDQNDAGGIGYQDITLGFGDIDLSKYFKNPLIPKIKAGASLSALVGGGVAETEKYVGSLHTSIEDGMQLKQEITAKTGVGGWGVKGMFSLMSEPISHLKVGASLDNIGGFIKWIGANKRYEYSVISDSVFVSDMSEDFTTSSDSSWTIGDFTTKLPMEMHLSALYQYRNANVSADYVQGFDKSQVTSPIGSISLAVEYSPIPLIPLQIGYRPGNLDLPWCTSYGIGLRGGNVSWGLGFQTFKSFFPGYKSTGVALSSNFSIHY